MRQRDGGRGDVRASYERALRACGLRGAAAVPPLAMEAAWRTLTPRGRLGVAATGDTLPLVDRLRSDRRLHGCAPWGPRSLALALFAAAARPPPADRWGASLGSGEGEGDAVPADLLPLVADDVPERVAAAGLSRRLGARRLSPDALTALLAPGQHDLAGAPDFELLATVLLEQNLVRGSRGALRLV